MRSERKHSDYEKLVLLYLLLMSISKWTSGDMYEALIRDVRGLAGSISREDLRSAKRITQLKERIMLLADPLTRRLDSNVTTATTFFVEAYSDLQGIPLERARAKFGAVRQKTTSVLGFDLPTSVEVLLLQLAASALRAARASHTASEFSSILRSYDKSVSGVVASDGISQVGVLRGADPHSFQMLVHNWTHGLASAFVGAVLPRTRRIVRLDVVLDQRTSVICRPLAKGVWDLDTGESTPDSPVKGPFPGYPPYHAFCRTILVPDVIQGDFDATSGWLRVVESVPGAGVSALNLRALSLEEAWRIWRQSR